MNFEEMANLAKMMKVMTEKKDFSMEEKVLQLMISSLKPEQQKNANIIMKYIEFENMAKRHKSNIQIQSGSKSDWRKNMILELKESFPEKRKNKLDLILKFIEINEVIKNFE